MPRVLNLAGEERFELSISRVRAERFSQLSYSPAMATMAGFEPAIS